MLYFSSFIFDKHGCVIYGNYVTFSYTFGADSINSAIIFYILVKLI